MNREELEEVFNRVYVGQFKKKEKKKVYDGSKTLDRNYFSRHRRVSFNNPLLFQLPECTYSLITAMGFLAKFIFQLNNTKRQTLPAPHCRNESCRYVDDDSAPRHQRSRFVNPNLYINIFENIPFVSKYLILNGA